MCIYILMWKLFYCVNQCNVLSKKKCKLKTPDELKSNTAIHCELLATSHLIIIQRMSKCQNKYEKCQ